MSESAPSPRSTDSEATPASKSAHGLVFVTLAVFSLAFGAGLALPATPSLIQSISGASIEDAAVIGGWMIALFAACQLLASPLIGRLSDRWGRRPVLLISLSASCVDYVAMYLATDLLWLTVARALAGLFCGIFAVSYATAADISDKRNLAAAFGFLGAAEGVGYLSGPVIGAILSGFGDRTPFLAAAALLLLALLYGLAFFRETLVSKPDIASGKGPGIAISILRNLSVDRSTCLVLSALFLLLMSRQVMPSIWPYYAKLQMDWGPDMIGVSIGLYGIVFSLAQIWLVRWLLKWRGELGTANIGLLSAALSGLAIAFLPSQTLVFVWLVFAALSGVALPAIRGIISNQVPPERQGQIQGLIGSLGGLSMLLGVPLLTYAFQIFADGRLPWTFPGAPFVISTLFVLGSIIALGTFNRLQRR